jgi:signal-transduction protein with cAMP-binding, CBS, and nucleotidyltransferase domain
MNTPITQVLDRKGRDVVNINPHASVFEAIQLMDAKQIGSLLILNKSGKVAGILSERDCFRKVILLEKQPRTVQVKDVMTRKVIYVTPETTVDDCMALMTQKRIRHLPVLENEKVSGVISIGDLVKFVTSEQDLMIHNLEKYIEGSL